MPAERIVALLIDEDRRGLAAAARASSAIARAAERLASALERGGRVVFLGAGTSGRLGVLEAAECPPTFGTDPAKIVAVMAGGPRAVFRSIEGAEDRAKDGRRHGARLGPDDVLVGISASSLTPFVRGALSAARAKGAETILVTCAPQRSLRRLAGIVVAIRTGPEVLTGSTRLKAGSATKAALNALTTAAMVRLGKTYQNLMVDLRPSSAKLRDRARRLVAVAAHVTPQRAARLLATTDGQTKTAIVMAKLSVPADEARRLLSFTRGQLRRSLEASKKPSAAGAGGSRSQF